MKRLGWEHGKISCEFKYPLGSHSALSNCFALGWKSQADHMLECVHAGVGEVARRTVCLL